ncbi:lipopolysaccharide/colanic/teichoic acid biosynthesis glycosyltransferase [Litoreibacter meonggei]|uniref:Lipopolysaccharide/colanic/teichoic acid biosynthesis glycosyltransferase n=1 Tax=Litoreibacter meonggei TaxID=1049199 RepID=A0A497WRR9_9RHOB|nr:sugar transferase [Litoreibacter meonggei]RLJ51964.1 lipopolysaccharide/colanic/teichoic acid biosynthesis glycosyltransferase [Litoreibacter meonggei]
MTISKRLFDLLATLLLGAILLPVILVTAVVVAILDGRPIFYLAERMKTSTQSFRLVKFRTMTIADADGGVSGGNKAHRVTRTGATLRRLRLDEIPQLWNVLRGDISFVGPRPPLREYVERFPEIYGRVLQSRPGITGLASIIFHRHEELLLAVCETPGETDSVYSRRCIPRKAQLDLMYQKNRNLCMDAWIMVKTIF